MWVINSREWVPLGWSLQGAVLTQVWPKMAKGKRERERED
jgi:hypothetical protein